MALDTNSLMKIICSAISYKIRHSHLLKKFHSSCDIFIHQLPEPVINM